jgi:hypothetical protein
MLKGHRNKLVLVVVALVSAVAVGGAVAATGAFSPREESQAIVDDAAEQLGVESSELTAALKQALKNRVDAAVDAGRLTEAQGEELKERIDANELPMLGFGPGGGPGFGHHVHFGGLEAAATFLGLTEAELGTELEEGNTLAEVAEAENKTVDGLVAAMAAAARADLAEAVEDGRLTDAQRDDIVATLEQRIRDKVNGELRFDRGPGGRGFPGFGPPPVAPDSDDGSASEPAVNVA